MKIKYLLFELLLFGIIVRGNEENLNPQDELLSKKDIEMLQFSNPKCEHKVCGSRGRCFINFNRLAECHCYEQYYTGPNCKTPTNPCNRLQKSKYIQNCNPETTGQCIAYFGNNYCSCSVHPTFQSLTTGRTCALLTEGEGRYAIGAGIYTTLQPVQQRSYPVFIACLDFMDTIKFRGVIEGFVYDFVLDQFTESSLYGLLSGFVEFLPGDDKKLIQTKMVELKHVFLKRGYNVFILTLYNNQGQGVSADWVFQYDVIAEKGLCIPSVEFSGGACG